MERRSQEGLIECKSLCHESDRREGRRAKASVEPREARRAADVSKRLHRTAHSPRSLVKHVLVSRRNPICCPVLASSMHARALDRGRVPSRPVSVSVSLASEVKAKTGRGGGEPYSLCFAVTDALFPVQHYSRQEGVRPLTLDTAPTSTSTSTSRPNTVPRRSHRMGGDTD